MRRQRLLRNSSAQSVCIFCACRLGVDVASTSTASSAQLAPFVSTTARRALRTTSAPQQSAATASSNGTENANSNASTSSAFQYDPNSSLTRREQEEKARRAALKQEQEIRDQQARQDQIWKDQEARLHARQTRNTPYEKRFRFDRIDTKSHHGESDSAATQVVGEGGGVPLSQSMFSKQKEKAQANPNIETKINPNIETKVNFRGTGTTRPATVRRLTDIQNDSNIKANPNIQTQGDKPPNTPRHQARPRNANSRSYENRSSRSNHEPPKAAKIIKSYDGRSPVNGPPKVAKPTFLPSSDSAQSTQQVSGWGMGATETKPLEYGDVSQPRPAVVNPAIEDVRDRTPLEYGDSSQRSSTVNPAIEDVRERAMPRGTQDSHQRHVNPAIEDVRERAMPRGTQDNHQRHVNPAIEDVRERAMPQGTQDSHQRHVNPAIEDVRERAMPRGTQDSRQIRANPAMDQKLEARKAMEQSKLAWRDQMSQGSSHTPERSSYPRQAQDNFDQVAAVSRPPPQQTADSYDQPNAARPTQPFGLGAEIEAPRTSDRPPQPQEEFLPEHRAQAAPKPSHMNPIMQALHGSETSDQLQREPPRQRLDSPSTGHSDEQPVAPPRRPQLHFSMSDAQEYKYDRDYSNQMSTGAGPHSAFPPDRFARSESRVPMSNRYDARYGEAPQTYPQRPQPGYAPVNQRDEYNPEYRIAETRPGRPAPSAYERNWEAFEDEQYSDAGPDPMQHRPATSAANSNPQNTPRHFGDEVQHSRYSQGPDQPEQSGQNGGSFEDSYDGIPLDAAQRRPEPHPSELGRYPQHVPRNARTFGFEEEHRRDPYYTQKDAPPPRFQPRNEAPPPSRFSGSFQNYENIQYDQPADERSDIRSRQYQRPPIGAETLGSFESDDFYESRYQYPNSQPQGPGQPERVPQERPQSSRNSFSAPHYHQDDQRRGAFGYDSFEHARPTPQQPQRYQDYDRRGVSQPFGDSYGPPSQVHHDDNDDGGQASFYDRQPAPYRPRENRYRAVPLDHRDLGQSSPPADEDNSANWQHLRRRNPEPVAPPAPVSPPAQYQSHPEPRRAMSDQEIDQMFRTHAEQRDAYNIPPPAPPPAAHERELSIRTIYNDLDRSQTKCGRCGEMGHIARDCPRGSNSSRHASAPGYDRSASAPRIRSSGSSTDFERKPRQDMAYRPPPNFEEKPQQNVAYRPAFQPSKPEETRESEGRTEMTSRYAVEQPAPVQEEESKRASRRRQEWVDDDDEVQGRDDRRKDRRANKRRANDEDDEDQSARDEYRARKAERQSREEAERQRNLKAARQERAAKKAEQATPITLPEFISVQNLSQVLGIRYEQFVEHLEELGYDDVFPGKTLNSEISGMIAMEYNFEPTFDAGAREEEDRDLKPRPEVEDKEYLPIRPPVVTIMGHVDHGKTTILDYLRKSSVAAGEAGGITQHIGAFSVPLSSSGKTITFLDTPGHAAFLAMRQRGANVTDLVILVVAADDSVKPQTLEALKHAKAAGVPIIVAINKVDKPEADVERVKADLSRHGVEIEDFGGDTQVVCVSGKTGAGMEELEENVVTLSEILDHRAETDGPVEGWVLEATTKKAGRVATILVRRGTLRTGSVIVAGKTWARVRSLKNEGGQTLTEVGPGMPVEVDGWKDQPAAGDEVLQAPNEQKATNVVEYRLELEEREKAAQDMEAINESRRIEQEKHEKKKAAEQASRRAAAATSENDEPVSAAKTEPESEEQSGQMTIPFIIKADVSGSAEAVSAYILSVASPLIAPQVLHSGVGAVRESDIELANAAEGHIIAFNLRADPDMKALAESRSVQILENNIIYRVLDDVKAVLEAKLPPIITQRVLGEAEVSANFEIGVGGRKKVKIAGCKVRNGAVAKNSRVRVTRHGEKIYDGTITSLKNVKKDVSEMRKGTECGMGFEGWEGFEVGDQIQTYAEVEERRKL